MSHSRPGCVLFTLKSAKDFTQSTLATAQQAALRQQLPMAVVYCLASWDEDLLRTFLLTEAELAKFDIPLMVLLGDPATTLAGLIHHTQPVSVFDAQSPAIDVQLVRHPHPWPGRIITIAELIDLHAAGQLTC